jgi:hypothetical protein
VGRGALAVAAAKGRVLRALRELAFNKQRLRELAEQQAAGAGDAGGTHLEQAAGPAEGAR